jgi:ABC-type branched-subunit amino acid transport system substrate-binding protein
MEVRRSGIIGFGFIGAVHARAVRASGGVVSAVAGSSLESAERAVSRLGAGVAAQSPAELIASDDVDIVHICTPNYVHGPLAAHAIKAGKHVICEKPLATDVSFADELTRMAEAAGVEAIPDRCTSFTGRTCRTGSPAAVTTTGASTQGWAACHVRSLISVFIGSTWWSLSAGTG